jgi:hypothetical protein
MLGTGNVANFFLQCSYLAPFSKRILVTPGLPSRQLKCSGVQPRLALDLNIDPKLRVGSTALYILIPHFRIQSRSPTACAGSSDTAYIFLSKNT